MRGVQRVHEVGWERGPLPLRVDLQVVGVVHHLNGLHHRAHHHVAPLAVRLAHRQAQRSHPAHGLPLLRHRLGARPQPLHDSPRPGEQLRQRLHGDVREVRGGTVRELLQLLLVHVPSRRAFQLLFQAALNLLPRPDEGHPVHARHDRLLHHFSVDEAVHQLGALVIAHLLLRGVGPEDSRRLRCDLAHHDGAHPRIHVPRP
mmetsp:Transcript_23600/g.46986  ORF Transcript_23600/g.46986 Transcript_23600/m.46986 type:complete len:202 (-) Transcript_23600:544-1149(-)